MYDDIEVDYSKQKGASCITPKEHNRRVSDGMINIGKLFDGKKRVCPPPIPPPFCPGKFVNIFF